MFLLDSKLALQVSKDDLDSLINPNKNNERLALKTYIDWLDKGRSVGIENTNNDLVIHGDIDNSQVISVGITHDSGWQIKDSAGNKLRKSADPFGNLVIYPKNCGNQEIYLSYKEGFDLWFGVGVSFATLIFIIWILPKKLTKILQWSEHGWGEDDSDN